MRTRKILSGQTLVEFALVLPLLLMLMMGLFDIGRAIFYYATLNTAVREGTRIAIVQPDCDYRSNPSSCTGGYLDPNSLNCNIALSIANRKICNEIGNKLFSIRELSSSTITISRPVSSTNDPKINIEIAFLFKPITPAISLMGDLTMRVNSQMFMTPIARRE